MLESPEQDWGPSWKLVTNLEDFDLFSQQRLGLSQVLLVDALHRHLPVVFLHGHITRKLILVSA